MNDNDLFLDVVQNGQFQCLTPTPARTGLVGLTRIPMQAAQPPESAEINLNEYGGSAVMVRGHNGGGWIYSAEVVDKAGPILTAVFQQVFSQK